MELLLLTPDTDNPESALPSLTFLAHTVRSARPDGELLSEVATATVLIVDARTDLAQARNLCQLLSASSAAPVVAVVSEGGPVAVSPAWQVDDILLPATGPAELDARLRLVVSRKSHLLGGPDRTSAITLGDLVIDLDTYTVRLRARPLHLTHKEFELLRHLAQHAGRVCTRAQLLQEVWGYDFFGGTRTVDVHVRRLRAKLGPDHQSLIQTVRNVGYKAMHPARRGGRRRHESSMR